VELPARELPRDDARGDEAIGGAAHQLGEEGIGRAVARQQPRRGADRHAQHRADEEAADEEIETEAGEIDLLHGFERERQIFTAPDEGPALNLGQDQHRRQERVRDVGRDVELEAVQPEQEADRQAQQQVEAEDWKRADEHAYADGNRLAGRAARLRPQIAHQPAHPTGQDASGRPGHLRRPVAAKQAPIRASRCRPRRRDLRW
jgi:hypothetical protein